MNIRCDVGIYLPGTKGRGGNVLDHLDTKRQELDGYSIDLHRHGVKVTNRSTGEWAIIPWHNISYIDEGSGDLKP